MSKKKPVTQMPKEDAPRKEIAQTSVAVETAPLWRERLESERVNREKQLLEVLDQEQRRLDIEWRKTERARLDEQERKLLEAIADRQAKLEDEWLMQRKNESESKALEWLRENQRRVSVDLQQGVTKLRQEMEAREEVWQAQCGQKLAQLEKEWREQFRQELQALEVDWREQEVMHRERSRFAELESELCEAQKVALTQQLLALREEGLVLQKETLQSHWLAEKETWAQQKNEWHQEWQETQRQDQTKIQHEVSVWQKQIEDGLRGETMEWKKQVARQADARNREWQIGQAEQIGHWLKDNLTGWNDHVSDIFRQWLAEEERHIGEKTSALNERETIKYFASWEERHSQALAVWHRQWQELQQEVSLRIDGRLTVMHEQLLSEVRGHTVSLGEMHFNKMKADAFVWQESIMSRLRDYCSEQIDVQRSDLSRLHQQEIELIGQDLRLDLGKLLERTAYNLSENFQGELENLSLVYREIFKAEQAIWLEESRVIHERSLGELQGVWRQEMAAQLERLGEKCLREMLEQHESVYNDLLERQESAEQEQHKALLKDFAGRFECLAVEWAALVDAEMKEWHSIWEENQATLRRQGEEFHEQSKAATDIRMLKQEAHILSENGRSIKQLYDQWTTATEIKLGEVQHTLRGFISSSVGEIVTSMEKEYLARLDVLKTEAHLDYRARLGKLVEEMSTRHKRELAEWQESREGELKAFCAEELKKELDALKPKALSEEKTATESSKRQRRGR